MGKIADTIYEELSYMYCDNCRHSSEDTDEDYSHCDECYRKYNNWAVSKETAECIEKLCEGYIDNLEKHSYIEGYKAGCEEGKKCYERPTGEWIMQLHNCDGEFYTCSVCGRMIRVSPYVEDNETLKDYPFCHCGADMRGSINER